MPSNNRPSAAFRWFRGFALAGYVFIVCFPLYTVVASSVKPLGDVLARWTWIPTTLTVTPYVDIWKTVPLRAYLVNSLVVSLAATVISLVLAILAAYALSRFRFFGRQLFQGSVLATQMLPGILFLIPLFILYINIGKATGLDLYGSRFGLILTYLTFALPFSIWMMTSFFATIPTELDEAGMVDGLGRMAVLRRIILPLSWPGVTAVAMFSFITAWSELLFAAGLTTEESRTVAIGLQRYATSTVVYWNQVMAASIVVSVPVIVLFLILQRQFVSGLTTGGVKG